MNHNSARLWPWIVVAGLTWSCEEGDTTAGTGDPFADRGLPGDGFDRDAFVRFDAFSARRDARPGQGGEAGPAPRGGFQAPCEDNLDCRSGWCVPFEDRSVCSILCLDEGCPDGWGCHGVANTEPDVVFICFPPGDRLCRVCLSDDTCPNGRCYGLDGLEICGLDCLNDDGCPDGYGCQDVLHDGRPSQCTPISRSCTCDHNNAGEQRLCERRNAIGLCYGRETCNPTLGWSACDAPTATAEVCNLVDDDCNGFTDDVHRLGEVCARSVDVDGGVIACSGRIVCTLDQPDPICTAPQPAPELCNDLDDDCDGETDEGFDQRGEICSVGVGECRRIGVQECSSSGEELTCAAEIAEPTPEACDGLDNDCDAQVDEDFPNLDEPCHIGTGACRRSGAMRCADDGSGARCSARAALPTPEACDSIDNDCDGAIDEDFANLGGSCRDGIGACERHGYLACGDDRQTVTCTAHAAAPEPERCNGLDDDCDGQIDEDYRDRRAPCTVGVGLCEVTGVMICDEQGSGLVCSAQIGLPSPERCNALDDDCDGAIDEDFPTLNTLCGVGVGSCARTGVFECAPGGGAVICGVRPAEPGAEICNGLDDDCDGHVDEIFADLNQPCAVGRGQCERTGVVSCRPDGSGAACDAVVGQPTDEICDGLDNDCDGESDEGFDGLDTLCTVGLGACQRMGIHVCGLDQAGIACNAEPGEPAPELCDGLDNNCNGETDELYPDLLALCEAGLGQCKANGVRICADDGGSTRCSAIAGAPEAERCDGLDNNCDGAVDDGFDALYTPCVVGLGRCRRPGVMICSNDGQSVRCDAEPGNATEEICDGLDNDCDGEIDEAFSGLAKACAVGAGACLRHGVGICASDGDGTICDAEPGGPQQELCDGLDNDCDGAADEDFPNLNAPCRAGVGVCERIGVEACSPDRRTVVCSAVPGPAQEADLCDGFDNDCDGQTDEGFPEINRPCLVGQGACERAGIVRCSDGGRATECDVAPGIAEIERCDGLDNDCDGAADEDYPALHRPCVVGTGACERSGIVRCSDNGEHTACDVSAGAPVAERCDGLDNDCDGVTDEGFDALGTPCQVGLGRCERAGVTICAPDGRAVLCDTSPGEAEPESCDGLDNDCDGEIDEGFPRLATACTQGRGTCQRPGVWVCTADGRGAECDARPGDAAAEVCDGLDNDCDGHIDEGFLSLGALCSVGVGACHRMGVHTTDCR